MDKEISRTIADKQVVDKGREIANELMDVLNNMTYERLVAEGFIDGFQRSHRTLQQLAGCLIYKLIKAKAEDYKSGNYDLRNEDFCKFCSDVIEKMGEQHFRYI